MISPNAPVRVLRLQRQAQALQLRIDGLTYDQIASELGVSKRSALRYVAGGVSDLKMDVTRKKEELRNIQLARLEVLLASLWRKIDAGDYKAVAVAVKVIERISRLNGLDAPKEVDATVRTNGPDLSQMSEGQLREHCRHLGIPVGDDLPQTSDPQGA